LAFEAFTEVLIRSASLWVVTPCNVAGAEGVLEAFVARDDLCTLSYPTVKVKVSRDRPRWPKGFR
jgi:hypothetical protein